MFRFAHIDYLWMLTALVPACMLFALYLLWRKRNISKFGNYLLVQQLMPQVSLSKLVMKFILMSLAYISLIIGFANPQIGTKTEKVKRQGIDVIIALDVSRSMLSEDVKPSRLDRAKNFVSNFMEELRNDRLGMIVFAGRAYLQMPLTVDYSAGKMYLRSVNTNMVPTQGTAIAEAVTLAMQSFVEEDTKHKALIIISDGEDNEEGAVEAIQMAAKEGIKVFTIGVGTDNGAPIPNGSDYKRDESGNIVLTKMNQDMLKNLAQKGNGKYFQLGSGKDEIQSIFKELGRIDSKTFEETVFTDFDDKYQWCIGFAVIMLLIDWWINERKNRFSFKI